MADVWLAIGAVLALVVAVTWGLPRRMTVLLLLTSAAPAVLLLTLVLVLPFDGGSGPSGQLVKGLTAGGLLGSVLVAVAKRRRRHGHNGEGHGR